MENIYLNQVHERVDIRSGSIETIRDGESFDVVLANINRNVILELLSFLIGRTNSQGEMLLTGLLHSDEEVIRQALSDYPVTISSQQEEDRKSTRLNSSHVAISYAVFCLKKKTTLE